MQLKFRFDYPLVAYRREGNGVVPYTFANVTVSGVGFSYATGEYFAHLEHTEPSVPMLRMSEYLELHRKGGPHGFLDELREAARQHVQGLFEKSLQPVEA